MAFVGLEPQWYIIQHLVFTTRPLAVGSLVHLIHLTLFSLACAINIRHVSSHKMFLEDLNNNGKLHSM
jgi:hypothetical protein